MRKLTIGTKAQADRVLVDSLFKPVNGRTLRIMKFCNGKYKADTSFIGREVEASDEVYAVYQVKRKDADGPYTQLMAVTSY